MTLTKCLHEFFSYYLPQIKGGSPQTLEVYKKTFELFLLFTAKQKKCSVQSLQLEHLSTEMVIAFLKYLEKDRHNSVRTRNLRLAAIKSLAKMIRLLYPEYREYGDNLRLIPQKRAQKKLIGYLYQDEILKVLATVDLLQLYIEKYRTAPRYAYKNFHRQKTDARLLALKPLSP